MKTTLNILAGLAALLLLLGYLGQLHPLFDSIAIGRWVAICALFAALFLRALLGRRIVLAALPLFALGLALVILRIDPTGEDGPVRVYTKNLLYFNTDMAPIIADIRMADPDVVVLQEISGRNKHILGELQASLPHLSICPWQQWNGIAILSRWPLVDAEKRCSPNRALMAVKVNGPTGDFWMIGAHLQHPWPDIQWPLLEESLHVIQNLDESAIVAGDFNTLYWTAAAQRVGNLTKTRAIRTKRPTFFLWNVGLHLDHVWASGGRAHVRPRFGSDHRGIVADVWP